MSKKFIFVLMIASLAMIIGCSSGGVQNITTPVEQAAAVSEDSHQIWGFWQCSIDPVSETLNFVEIRDAAMHLNAMKFLEPPVGLYLKVENVQFDGGIIIANISLRHPFIGLEVYTGFDVTGILISHGSDGGFNDSDLMLPGDGDTRLLNADGFTRWWNPAEFPVNDGTIFSYQDGLLGSPQGSANFDATLNGYKYFSDGLNADTPMWAADPEGRGVFSAGVQNTRHYDIAIGNSLSFNYAVDANWKHPLGSPPFDVPGDFDEGANRPEAWNISVTELDNSFYNENGEAGGSIGLSIDVYDHFNAGMNTVSVETPGQVPFTQTSSPVGGGVGYSTYIIDIPDCTPSQAGDMNLLITVGSEKTGYGGLLPGKTISAYFLHTTIVDDTAPTTEIWSDEFVVAEGGRFPTIAQSASGRVVATWATNPGLGWSEFTSPDSWTPEGVLDSAITPIRNSIAPGILADDIVVMAQDYGGTMSVAGEPVEFGHPLFYRWDGASSWAKWDTEFISNQLMMHGMVDNQGRFQWFFGTRDAYGHPVHCQFSEWEQSTFFDYQANYYDGYANKAEIGYSRCWGLNSQDDLFMAYEFDYAKNPYQPPQNIRGLFVAVQYLPNPDTSVATQNTVVQTSDDYCDSASLAIGSDDVVHLVYRLYRNIIGRWQIVHQWSADGINWAAGDMSVVWEGLQEPERRYISLDIDSQDRLHVTYKIDADIWYTRSSDGLSWGEPEFVNESIADIVGVGDHQQWMFTDANGHPHVIWTRVPVIPDAKFGQIRHRWRIAD